jgi:hypothetical protein
MRSSGISLYVHGSPGISKSAVAQQSANAFGVAFIDFRLSQVAPEDIRGVPIPGEIDGMKGVLWTPPLVFPRDLDYEGVARADETGIAIIRFFNPKGNNGIPYCSAPQVVVETLTPGAQPEVDVRENRFVVTVRDDQGKRCEGSFHWRVTGNAQAILALEEFNSASPGVMAAAYQLILDRRIGDYVVPDGVMLLAMGNRDIDHGVTYQIGKPVANRFVHLEMEFNWDDWFVWASNNDISPEVLGYLSRYPQKTNDFDPDSPDLAFSTPRSWEFVSKILQRDPLPSADVLRALICGAVGDANGNEFVQHRRYMADMPDVDDILSGSVTTFKVSNPQYEMQIAYSLSVQLCYELRIRLRQIEKDYPGNLQDKRQFNKHPARVTWLAQADRAFAYAVQHFKPEVAILMARLSIINHALSFAPTLMPHFRGFLDDYQFALKQ